MKYLNSIVLAIFLTACTDYVQQMDEDFEEWELAQELANSSSSSQKVKSSSSLKSSSSETSSSSTKSSSSAESSSSEEAPVSSSADKVSSSSVVKPAESSSSSVAYVEPCNVDGKDSCEYGTLVDARDGQNYKTVTIGTQIWMAQNLNYAIDESRCHNNVASGCSRFGRLYTWAMAMDSVGAFSNNGKGCGYADGTIASACSPVYPVRGICPEGWHLPTGGELKILIKAVGGGTKPAVLQVVGFTAWKDATDEYGFSAIPIQADFQNPKSSVFDLAIIWGATIDESGRRSESMGINTTGIFVYPDDSGVGHYNSIRCLYDKPAEPKSSSSSSAMSSSSSTVVPQSSSSSITVSSSSEKEVSSSSSEIIKSSSSVKASWTYLNPAISYGEMTDDRDGQVYKTVVIGEQTWMAENLNFETENSYCYDDSASNCAKYGRLYTWSAALGACPANWHLPSNAEWEDLFTAIGGRVSAVKILKSASGWNENGNGTDDYGFSALPIGYRSDVGVYGDKGKTTNFWSFTEVDSGSAYDIYLYYNVDQIHMYGSFKNFSRSVRCLKGSSDNILSSSSSMITEKSSSSESLLFSSSSKASWAYLNPSYSYGEMTDDRDGQVYKTVDIDSKTWMAENLNYESVKSYCYENKKDSCSKYGHLYIWSAAMDSIGAFSTNSKGCGYPNECNNTKNPVRGVCPEKWHLPSQQEWYDLSTYNSSTISGDLSSAGERLKSANGWFSSGNGDNTYGFSVLPAGIGSEENYSRSGEKTCFWSSSDKNGIDAYGIHFEYSHSKGVLQGTMKSVGCSIRCVKD